jgi:deoxyribonuclease IV
VRIGAHVSTSGGVHTAPARALDIGANCIQIFAGPPQRWAAAALKDDDVAEFRRLSEEKDILPAFIHAAYLINPASADPALRDRSISSLLSGLSAAERLGAVGVITHLGSSKDGDVEQAEAMVSEAISAVLSDAPDSVWLLLETCAGQGNTIGRRFEQIGSLLRQIGSDPRLRVCLDTAHVFEAGYDVTTSDGLEYTLDEFDRAIGITRLAAIHINDSKTPLGSNVDRHENIGFGLIGEDAFARILQHPVLRQIPFLLEVPGLANEGPDAANIQVLRRLAGLKDA